MFSSWGLTWRGWLDNRRGEWWLLAQLLLIAAHLLPAPERWGISPWPRPLVWLGALMVLWGLGLALQDFITLGSNLSPLPEPKDSHQLIQEGPYQQRRHPMYQAVLVCSAGMVIAQGSLLHLLLLLALGLVLGGKARREERALLLLHPTYATYQRTTAAIIPGLPWLDWR